MLSNSTSTRTVGEAGVSPLTQRKRIAPTSDGIDLARRTECFQGLPRFGLEIGGQASELAASAQRLSLRIERIQEVVEQDEGEIGIDLPQLLQISAYASELPSVFGDTGLPLEFGILCRRNDTDQHDERTDRQDAEGPETRREQPRDQAPCWNRSHRDIARWDSGDAVR